MNDQSLSKLLWYFVHENDGEPLAQYIESGGDLSGATEEQRQILARIVRGKSPRRRGQKLGRGLAERDWQICLDIACMRAKGLPAYTYSRHDAKDACSVIAEQWKLGERTVRKIWSKRDKSDTVLQFLEMAYKGQSIEDSFEENTSREEWIVRMQNAWKEED